MKRARVFVHHAEAGIFEELEKGRNYRFTYHQAYRGPAVSLTMPVQTQEFTYKKFPAFFDGLLPEGPQLEGLLKARKIDRDDFFEQLIAVGHDLIGAVSVKGEL